MMRQFLDVVNQAVQRPLHDKVGVKFKFDSDPKSGFSML